MKDQRMEELSDLVRKGTPIDFTDALAVIEYQEALREQRNIKKAGALRFIKRALGVFCTLIALSTFGFFLTYWLLGGIPK